jgi:toxin FitB
VTACELLQGVALMPQGKRRESLGNQVTSLIENDFAGRCLSLDVTCAKPFAQLREQRQLKGLPMSLEDSQIAAIAIAHQKVLVTRNVKDFEHIQGLTLRNPWDGR